VIARGLGFVPLLIGAALVVRARTVNEWTFRINRDLFGWEPSRLLRLYGLLVVAGIGIVLALLGVALIVGGSDAVDG
jgi:hypothetical protein